MFLTLGDWSPVAVMRHWREWMYWRWLWSRTPGAAKLVALGVVFAGLLGGGWVVADRTASEKPNASSGDRVILVETTVQKAVTLHEKGRIVRKLVPVVRKLEARQRATTVYQGQLNYVTRVVAAPTGAIHTVAETVPVVSTQQITVNGAPRTVVSTRSQPTTMTRTVVATHNVTQTAPPLNAAATRTVTSTQTNPPETRTVTSTQTKTQTLTQTQTNTETVTRTATETVTLPAETLVRTVTETAPPVTVTVTVPKGKP